MYGMSLAYSLRELTPYNECHVYRKFSHVVLFQMRTARVSHKMSVEIRESAILVERLANCGFFARYGWAGLNSCILGYEIVWLHYYALYNSDIALHENGNNSDT
jgi:hypothetical protein